MKNRITFIRIFFSNLKIFRIPIELGSDQVKTEIEMMG
jgi:hypothetical protein